MKEHGLCDKGIIPQFYGSLENIDIQRFQPHFEAFLNDKHAPGAIFLEYIPHMQRIMPELYTKRRMQNFISGIREIHKALVLHCDVNPRNMMVVENDPERAVWLDFDRAQTYYADNLSQRQKSFIKMEELNVSQFAEGLVSHSRGKVYENSESLDANLLCCDRDAIINKGKYMTPSCTTAPKKSKEQRTARTGVF